MKYQPYKKIPAHLLGIAIGMTAAMPLNIVAAPGAISEQPLFLTNKAEPNIFFMADDSGSMDWELTTDQNDGVMDNPGDADDWRYVFEASDNEYGIEHVIPAQENVDDPTTGVWRARNHLYNKMYYNPKINYKPWPGVDDNGDVFEDAYIHSGTPTWNTHLDPYDNDSAVVVLSADMSTDARDSNGVTMDGGGTTPVRPTNTFYPARYWVWDDTIGATSPNDGIIDQDDSHTKIEIKTGTAVCDDGDADTDIDDISVTLQRTDACMLRSYADEMKNFANWYTYSRRREYAAKAAMASVVKSASNVRMGMATIQDRSSEEALASMNNDITSGNKKDLVDAIYSIRSDNGTPLREALQSVGNYYSGSGQSPFMVVMTPAQ